MAQQCSFQNVWKILLSLHTQYLTLVSHGTPTCFDIFYQIFFISDGKDHENLSLWRKFKILPSVFSPVRLDIYDSLDEVVTGLWAEADCEPYSAKIDPPPVDSTKHNEAKDFLELHYLLNFFNSTKKILIYISREV